MKDALDLLNRLCPDDPWQHSFEGLDDCCLFCRSDQYQLDYEHDDNTVRYHQPDCVWMEAMDFLGRDRSLHRVTSAATLT